MFILIFRTSIKNHASTIFVNCTSGGETSVSASFDFVESSQDDSNDEDNLQATCDKCFFSFFFLEEYSKLRKLNKRVFEIVISSRKNVILN